MTTPSSTYRLQFGGETDLARAERLADYLDALGVGALYASPLLRAAPGSTHGYDVTDPSACSEVLGGEAARASLSKRLRSLGLGLVVDIVPNHVGIAVPSANPWWWDVLRSGPASPYARYFDIDFARGPVTLPVLDDDSLDDLRIENGQLCHRGLRLPIAPGTGDGTPRRVHDRQHYRLIPWRRGDTDLNHRRFFDITTLAGVRVEDPEVFDAVHGEVLRWVAAGEVTGLRVDHPDGLADPGGYCRRLRAAAPRAWLVVEKILGPDESPPASWPVDGTTGYDALRLVCGVFVDPAGQTPLTDLAASLGVPTDLDDVSRRCRLFVAERILRAETNRIARLVRLPDHDGDPVDPEMVEDAVALLLASTPVYRSYLPEGRVRLDAAVESSVAAFPLLAGPLRAIRDQMLAEPDGELTRRVQQTSGMVMAKGVEDTAFYRFNRFVALNEVGGAPERFGVEVEEFHARSAYRQAAWPATMTALSTHDTKRGEDVRARLAVLSELPGEFASAVTRWTATHGLAEPTLNLLAWQTLLGAWPISAGRLGAYLVKAAREAKIATSWTDPDPDFEATVTDWAHRVVTEPAIRDDLAAFVTRIEAPGYSNSLGQKLVHLCSPGVPDVYQGTELWDFSLVDPDNRRPVDFAARTRLLERLDRPPVDASGAAKLWVTHRALRLRRDRPGLFTGYRALSAEGPSARHALAFQRSPDLVAVATRLPVGLAAGGGWHDTVLPLPPGADWVDTLTDRSITSPAPSVAELFAHYPVALLIRRSSCG